MLVGVKVDTVSASSNTSRLLFLTDISASRLCALCSCLCVLKDRSPAHKLLSLMRKADK